MFGYVKPYKPELKVREWETYRAVYCGLCNVLKARYGFAARFAVNYDFTFFVMLMSSQVSKPPNLLKNDGTRWKTAEVVNPDVKVYSCNRRCPATLKKRPHCFAVGASELAADLSVILAWYKLIDEIHDVKGLKGLVRTVFAVAPAMLFLRAAFKRAAAAHNKFAEKVKKTLDELAKLEHNREASAVRVADTFAEILAAAAEVTDSPTNGADADPVPRVLPQLLFHIGRCIYLADALDDLDTDRKTGSYNPLLFGTTVDEAKSSLEASARTAAADFELLPPNDFHDILENIFYLGIYNAVRSDK